jgi:hypothetical protein
MYQNFEETSAPLYHTSDVEGFYPSASDALQKTFPQPFPILRQTSSDSTILLFRSDVGRRPTRFLLRLFARCRSLFDAFPHVVRTLANI